MKEYMVCYTVNGNGYSDTEPWIDTRTEDPVEARQAHDGLIEWAKVGNQVFDVWLEARDIGPWERLDAATLTC